ncbi:MAG: hypothetical protein HY925_06670 [Elusimicrobia bacterium]|nr:hypothetical protein [Elusimicrobiota bacterium]
MRYPGIAAALVLPLLLNNPLFAADPDDDSVEPTQWTVPEVTPPSPSAPTGSSEGDYANQDRRRMDEQRRKDVLDQLCRHIRLNHDFHFGGNGPRATLGVSRRMEADVNNELVLLDEEKLEFGWNYGKPIPMGDDVSGSVAFGASMSGKSTVARRLGTFSSCNELDRLVNVTDIKVVVPILPGHLEGIGNFIVPISAESIANMQKGELWRLPLTVNLNYGAGAGAAASDMAISLGYSKSKNGASSMTLWRLDEKRVRFRFRVDFVQVVSKSVGFSQTFPPIEFAEKGANILSTLVRRQIAGRLHRYTSAYIGFSSAKSDGRRLLLEYVIDPTKREEAEALAEALRGNFILLTRYGLKVQTTTTSREESLEAYDKLQNLTAEHLGDADYAARSDYQGYAKSFPINIPFFVSRTLNENLSKDSVTRFTGDGGVFEFNSANRSPNVEYFNAPFIGPIVKDLESRNVDVITMAPDGISHVDPIAVYVHNQGFLRLPASSVRMITEDANSVLRLAGVARTGRTDRSMEIPAERFLPPVKPVPAYSESPEPRDPSDQKGWTSFTLVMNQKAVKEALSATIPQVLQAFSRAVPIADRDWAAWLASNGTYRDGKLEFDERKAKEELGISNDGATSGDLGWLRKLAVEAGGLAADLAEASVSHQTPEARSASLAKATSHKNRSGLPPQDVIRVLVQFMDPLDLTGDFVSAVDGTTKHATKIQAHYQLKQGRAEVPMLRAAGETRARFGDGGALTD